MFRVVSSPNIRSTYNCIYNIWYLLTVNCYLPLLWESWSWSECGVGIVLICFGAVASAYVQKAIIREIKADSHIACRAHAVPLSCRAAEGL